MRFALIVLALLTVAGCVPTSKPVEFRPQGQASNTRAVQKCESQNDPKACNDMRVSAVDAYVKALEADYEDTPPRNLQMMTAMSEQYDILIAKSDGKAYDPPGGRPFKAFDDIEVKTSSAAQASGATSCELVNGPKGCTDDGMSSETTEPEPAPEQPIFRQPDPEPAPATDFGAVDISTPQPGTWYCEDSVDGAGNYGIWEMTQQTDRYYNCKRVN